MVSRPALRAFAPRPVPAVAGSVPFSMPLGLTSGRRFTPLRVATSARRPATAPLRAAFSASSRSTSASSSPRGRPERAIFSGADMAGTGRVRAAPAQPRQLTSARPFAPRTPNDPRDNRSKTDRFIHQPWIIRPWLIPLAPAHQHLVGGGLQREAEPEETVEGGV